MNNNLVKKIVSIFCCYFMGSIGSVITLIVARSKGERLIALHGAQAMLVSLFISFAYALLGTIGLASFALVKVITVAEIAFIVFGTYNLATDKPFRIPYITDLAQHWV